ncbi:MAG: DUF2062 domain-containing protein [Candidatus Omnitrophota bacterium]
MHKDNVLEKAAHLFKSLYFKLIKINDTPHKIAVGFGIGVFAGIMPFAGPIIAIFLAVLFKVNRAAAFLGALITNTWISVAAFFLSISIGSSIFDIDGETIKARWMTLLKDFHLASLFKASVLEIILPVVIGYIVIAIISALAAYAAAITIMKLKNRKKTG